MKERPILFSAPMVRAILAGVKTQTRRVVKLHNDQYMPPSQQADKNGLAQMLRLCPYGAPGDRLLVREAWRASSAHDSLPPRDIPPGDAVEYAADTEQRVLTGKLRPSMFMPRWASRITLEIVNVRFERLQDISEADARAEGVNALPLDARRATPKADFEALWESINGPGSWDANPWVWCVEFRRAGGAT